MSLTTYIPLREATLQHRGKDIPALGIKRFSIEVERLSSVYEIWVDVNQASSIIEASDNVITSGISMVPTEMDESATFVIDGFSISCVIKYYAYHSLKHAYLIRLEFPLDRNKVKTYIFEKDSEDNREQTRFDILDL